jgi:uncharacterized YigZ family protein
MEASDSFKTIKSVSEGIYKEKGSKFIAFAYPVFREEEIKAIIEKTRKAHYNAKHHCFAYVLGSEGDIWRVNDDGEPSGTGGRPILGQIRSHDLTNTIIVVSRYFGGTLLGVSRLANAYKSAAMSALNNAEIIDHIMQEFYEIEFPYSAMNDVMMVIKEENIAQSKQSFNLECRLMLNFRSSAKERILDRLSRISGLNYRFISSG